MDWAEAVCKASLDALLPARDDDAARSMSAYMKDVAPFLGIKADARRGLCAAVWRDLPRPRSDELGHAAQMLMDAQFRELHYCAYDLIAKFRRSCDEAFLPQYGQALLLTKPWWDTVDGLGSAAVSPLCKRFGHENLIERWSGSGNVWLIRSAIQHQRGWKSDTQIQVVLQLCDAHADDTRFFVAKAIGWALRDLTRLDAAQVAEFVQDHPALPPVARREALRGLARS